MCPNVPKAYSAWTYLLLNLSKKVKFHLFCLNLDTGYLLYVIIWIPKAFSLLTHHSRVVFTISNGFSLGGGKNLPFFAMFHLNLLIEKSISILTLLHPTHRCNLALIKEMINVTLLEVKL